jgi:hypothetical protein
MIALNIFLMTAVLVGIVSLLAWAIVSDRRSKRTAGGELSLAAAPLHHNLVMPHELRVHRGTPKIHATRVRAAETNSSAA